MSFHAKYSARCGSCDDRIEVGERIDYEDDELVHVGCLTHTPRSSRRGMCGKCWLVHAGECDRD